MSTLPESPAASAPGGAALAAPLAHSVAEDLAAIFPHAPPAPAANTLRLGGGRPTAAKRPSGGRRPARVGTLGALAAAVLIGLSAGALFGRWPDSAPVATAASLPGPGPLPSEPMQAPASRIRAAAANPVTPARVRKVSAPRPARYGRPRAKSCGGEACRSSSVTAADARLQRAYARAERAGVSIDELDRYHERWTKLDPEASRQPGMVTASYDAMAVDLNRLAAQRQAAPAPRGPPPSRTPRTEVAALWR